MANDDGEIIPEFSVQGTPDPAVADFRREGRLDGSVKSPDAAFRSCEQDGDVL